MSTRTDVWQGTLALMILKTLETLGPVHGYGIARRIEQTSGHHLRVHYGTLYASLLKLEQEGYIASGWGVSDNNRKAKFYRLTRAGRKHVSKASRDWQQATEIVARFLTPGESTRPFALSTRRQAQGRPERRRGTTSPRSLSVTPCLVEG
jgi:PadR family transcriptional regulator PadR